MTREELLTQIAKIQPTLGGWTSVAKASLLAATIYDNQLTNGLEIGVYCGGSVIPAALAFRCLGRGTMLAVDPWQPSASVVGQDQVNAEWWGQLDHEAIYQEFLSKADLLGLNERYVKTYRMTNRDVFPLIKNLTFGYLNIDGNHSAEEAVWDVGHFVPLVAKGGYIWFDDIVWQGQSKAYELLTTLGVEEVCKQDTGALFRKVV